MNTINLIVVPDEDDPDGASLYVEGTLGSQPYQFLLDTGAARTCMVYDAYTASFESVGQRQSSGVFAKSSDDLISVPSLAIGPITKAPLTVVRLASDKPDLRTLLGMDILKDFYCHFRFDEGRVLVDAADERADDEHGADEPSLDLFLDAAFHPYVEVHYEAVTANAVWDTGASVTIVDMNFVRQHPAQFQQVGRSTGTDSTGVQMETPMFLMSEATIGGSKFPPQQVAGVDLSWVNATIERPMNLILGYTTLIKAHWIMDFPRRRWAISKRVDVP